MIMLSQLRKAYYGGWRAGRSPSLLITYSDGSKRLAAPGCPYTLRRQLVLRWLWEAGWQAGMMQKLTLRRSA